MAIRWRQTGELLCAAKVPEMAGDTYIDDRLHYQLHSVYRLILPDPEEYTNGVWHWKHSDHEHHNLVLDRIG